MVHHGGARFVIRFYRYEDQREEDERIEKELEEARKAELRKEKNRIATEKRKANKVIKEADPDWIKLQEANKLVEVLNKKFKVKKRWR